MPNKNGLILLEPTSVVGSGTSPVVTINANGSVSFSSTQSVRLNGIFSSAYDNYMIVMRHDGYINPTIVGYLSSGGSDATGTYYNFQTLTASSTTVAGARNTGAGYFALAKSTSYSSGWKEGLVAHLYGPYLAQPTAYRSIAIDSASGAATYDAAGTHGLSTSYDGLNIATTAGGFEGLVCVYGMRN